MPANITSVTVLFGHGIKREEYGPTKKAEVSITASVSEQEDGAVILAQIGSLALAKVADLLNAPKPVDPVALGLVTKEGLAELQAASGEAPARRTRGPNKPKDETPATATGAEPAAGGLAASEADTTAAEPPAEDEWAAGSEAIEITDAELLSATSKRAGELGARDPIIKLIASFATRTEGAPFKVQEIPQGQRKDYLTKLAALKA